MCTQLNALLHWQSKDMPINAGLMEGQNVGGTDEGLACR